MNVRDILNKRHFIIKVIYNRLNDKFGIDELTTTTIGILVREFDRIIKENGYSIDIDSENPISYKAYINISNKCIPIIKSLRVTDEVDIKYAKSIVDCLLWANKLYLYCTYYERDKSIMAIESLREVRGPFYDDGYTTLLDLALIYDNTNDYKYISGVGPKKYSKFKRFFTTDCTEFKIYEKEA